MPRMVIDDGYTIEAATSESVTDKFGDVLATGLPVVSYRYRPALPDALAEWRHAIRKATSGRAEVDATAKLVADHLVDWDVTDSRDVRLPTTAENVRKVPEPVLNQILEAVTSWAPKAADAAGNSRPG